jgi:shikimate dehydrogenase
MLPGDTNRLMNSSRTSINILSTSGSTGVYAVIGDPIAHTLSPAIHNAAFKSLNMNHAYVPFRVRENDLGQAIAGLRSLGVNGFNVTMPHKSSVLRFMDTIDATAKKIGAVNTVVRRDSRFHGYNTDGVAAVTALSRHGSLSGEKIVILGAGGAARAIAYYLAPTVESIVILNRTHSNGARLAHDIAGRRGASCQTYPLDRRSICREAARGNVLINTLPVSAFPRFGKILVQDELVKRDMLLMDVNYEFKSDFLSRAKLSGARIIDGIEMLIGQAALSFKLWTGHDAPIKVMRKAAAEARARR